MAKNAEIAAGWRVQELGTKKMVDTVVGQNLLELETIPVVVIIEIGGCAWTARVVGVVFFFAETFYLLLKYWIM